MAGYNHPNTLVGAPVGTSAVTAVGNPYAAPGAMQNYYDQRSAANNAAAWGTAGVPAGVNPPQQSGFNFSLTAPQIDWSALLGGMGGGGRMTSYNSGINAGPVYGPEARTQAQSQIRNAAAPQLYGAGGPGMTPAQLGALQQTLGAGVSGESSRMATQAGREMSAGDAQQQLASETARAQDGLRSLALAQAMRGQNMQQQAAQRNNIFQLLGMA